MMKRIFGPKKQEVIRSWRKLHSEELRNFYSSLYIVRLIKWRRIMWAELLVLLWEKTNL
jgi:hypothetical protein